MFTDKQAREYILKNETQLGLKANSKTQQEIWQIRFPDASPLAIDLLTKLLSFNPKNRISIYEAIEHEYFA